jgi:hypothetical protein
LAFVDGTVFASGPSAPVEALETRRLLAVTLGGNGAPLVTGMSRNEH